jgi:hypothetical protein
MTMSLFHSYRENDAVRHSSLRRSNSGIPIPEGSKLVSPGLSPRQRATPGVRENGGLTPEGSQHPPHFYDALTDRSRDRWIILISSFPIAPLTKPAQSFHNVLILMKLPLLIVCLLSALVATASAADPDAQIKDPSISGGVANGKLRVVIEGLPDVKPGDRKKVIFSTDIQQSVKATRDNLTYQFAVALDILQGKPKELPLTISGEGEIKEITGDSLQDWSIRKEADGSRTLILRPKEGDKPLTKLIVNIAAERDLKGWKNPLSILALTPPEPALLHGFVKVESAPEFDIQPDAPAGLIPVEAKFLPESMRGSIKPGEPEPLAFQFHGSAYALPLKITAADPEMRQVVLRDFKLTGALTEQNAAFTLTATAHVANPRGGSITLLSGSSKGGTTDPSAAQPAPSNEDMETVWVDDDWPAGANLEADGDVSEWITAEKGPVFSGKRAIKCAGTGMAQSYYDSGAAPFEAPAGGKLFAYVYLDPANPPKAVMLQYLINGDWSHRAVWGDYEAIDFGDPNTPGKVNMGPLPNPAVWTRLEVDEEKLGIKPGDLITGLAYTQCDGTVYWDKAGVTTGKGAAGLALSELPPHPDWRVTSTQGRFVLAFDRPGDFPVQIKFDAAVRQNAGWSAVDFHVAPSALQPILLQGLAADTQFQFQGAARPERAGADFTSFLPPDGAVKLSWKTAAPEAEGKLFYAAEMLAQISVGPGLMQQAALLDCKVMQGELDRVTLLLRGAGEVTRVQGGQVLAWRVEPGANADERRLVVQFNQPQKDQFALHIQTQTPIGAFPQTVDAMQLRPEGATRFAGYFRIVNEGAVRLEVAQARGLSQVSPEQFPESDATKSAFHAGGEQRFVYRFSGADFALRIQADQILPELTASELLAYHFGENEQSIDAEIELDVREAPLRELLLRVPKGYAVAKLAVAGLSDYFLHDADADAELRLVYAQPVSAARSCNSASSATRHWAPRIGSFRASMWKKRRRCAAT